MTKTSFKMYRIIYVCVENDTQGFFFNKCVFCDILMGEKNFILKISQKFFVF